jgi:hypothetical protein
MAMRRFPLIGLTISLLLLPARANASVPDPRVRADLVGGTGPSTIASAVGDVTGDGIPDLIVARGADAGAEAYTVAVFAGPLTGSLPTAPSFTVTPTAHSDAYRLAIGDLNNDGNDDLAVAAVDGVNATDDPTPGIDVFLEAGGSLPATASDFMTPIPVLDVAIADLDDDGLDDLLFTRVNSTPIEVRERLQQGDGSFAAGAILASDAPASGLSVGDVNHDGLNDFSLDGSMTGSVPVFVQSAADHTFAQTDVPLDAIPGVSGAVLSDVNDDTNDDLLVVTDGDGLAWALADGAGGFGAFSSPMAASAVSAKEVADLNGDGLVDLATFGGDGFLRIYLQQSDGGLGAACSFPGTSTPGDDAATSTGDQTSDGAADIVDADVGGTSGGAWLFEQLTGGALLTTSVDALASKTSMQVFHPVTISGTFHNSEGGCLRQGSVSLSRSGPDGTIDLGSTAFAADGSFSFQDTPTLAGDYTYTVSFAGDETHEASSSSTLNLQVTKIPTSLSLRVSDATITFGDGTKLSATLNNGSPTSHVVFQRKGNDGDWHAFDVRAVGNDAVATIRVEPGAEARYRVAFLATPNRMGSVSSSLTVQVHAVMRSRMIGKSTKDGRYTVYKCCTAYFWVKLRPLHPGVKWTAAVQYYGNGKWRSLGKATYKLERDGDAAIFLNAVTGYRYRVRGHFDGDADHLGATSKWNYFKYR